MISNFSVAYDSSIDFETSQEVYDIFQNNKIRVKPVHVEKNNFMFYDFFNNEIPPHLFAGMDCIYEYVLMETPIYVGSSTNFFRNRLTRQLPALYINKFFNMKSPSLGYNRKNAREKFIYDIHELNINKDALTLNILCLNKNVLKEKYNKIIEITKMNNIGFVEQGIINTYIRNGIQLLNKVPATHHRKLTSDISSGSKFSHDVYVKNRSSSLDGLFVK